MAQEKADPGKETLKGDVTPDVPWKLPKRWHETIPGLVWVRGSGRVMVVRMGGNFPFVVLVSGKARDAYETLDVAIHDADIVYTRP